MAAARKILKLDRPFPMRRGGALQDVQIAYETWGDLSFCNDNAILIFTGLSPRRMPRPPPRIPRRAGGKT